MAGARGCPSKCFGVGTVSREFASRPGRTPVEMPIALRSAGLTFFGTSENIGMGGLFVAVDRSLAIGERITVEFKLPDHAVPMSVDAEVRWIRPAGERQLGAGMRFVSPSIGAMVALYELLRRFDQDRTPSRRLE